MKKRNLDSIDPRTLPAIKYCKAHKVYINLLPHVIVGDGKEVSFRVICPDCGIFGTWEKTIKEAIISWNKKFGIAEGKGD